MSLRILGFDVLLSQVFVEQFLRFVRIVFHATIRIQFGLGSACSAWVGEELRGNTTFDNLLDQSIAINGKRECKADALVIGWGELGIEAIPFSAERIDRADHICVCRVRVDAIPIF